MWNQDYHKPIHFTQDGTELEIERSVPSPMLLGSFARVLVELKVYNCAHEVEEIHNLSFDVPYTGPGVISSQDRARIDLGKAIEPHLEVFKKPFRYHTDTRVVYPPAVANIEVQEIFEGDVIESDELPRQFFLKGRNTNYQASPLPAQGNSPEVVYPEYIPITSESFWLSPGPSGHYRATPNSVLFFSAFNRGYYPDGDPLMGSFKIYKNGNLIAERTPITTLGWDGAFPHYLFFLTANLRLSDVTGLEPGDRIIAKFKNVASPQTYLVYPLQKYSYNIGYCTQWETMNVFEFTGPARIPTDYEQVTSERIKDYVRKTKKHRSTKRQTVVFNTGWIRLEDRRVIDDLVDSRLAFLLPDAQSPSVQQQPDIFTLYRKELVPTQSKITAYDDDEKLISMDVEFTINKDYENEVYSL